MLIYNLIVPTGEHSEWRHVYGLFTSSLPAKTEQIQKGLNLTLPIKVLIKIQLYMAIWPGVLMSYLDAI